MRTVVALTGASGAVYGIRLLEVLPGERCVILSDEAVEIAADETGLSRENIEGLAETRFSNDDLHAPIASGSVPFDNMVVAPCSMSTMSKIACGIGDNLITRAASVALKERRRLILIVRETPLSTIHLQNMERLSAAGAMILPACPAFYPKPKSVSDMVDFVVGRALDMMGLENKLYKRWSGKAVRGSRGSPRTRR